MGWIYFLLCVAVWLAGSFATLKLILAYDLDLFDESLTKPENEKDLIEWAAFWPLFWAITLGTTVCNFLRQWMVSFIQIHRSSPSGPRNHERRLAWHRLFQRPTTGHLFRSPDSVS